jgi:hypothetical protein
VGDDANVTQFFEHVHFPEYKSPKILSLKVKKRMLRSGNPFGFEGPLNEALDFRPRFPKGFIREPLWHSEGERRDHCRSVLTSSQYRDSPQQTRIEHCIVVGRFV